jgi:serine/threonine protein phosphatase PrpC
LLEGNYYIAHIGDSRIYCYENETLAALTSDDVSESGKLTAYIGRNDGIFLQYFEGEAIGKTFLLCSDGLYKRMDVEVMAAQMKRWNKETIEEPIETLPKFVIERGERDNISLAFVKIEN